MCGIAGIFGRRGGRVVAAELVAMTRRLAHRGPDDEGFAMIRPGPWRAEPFTADQAPGLADGELGLGHRRLSILDLSAAGHQPMQGPHGTWVVFNGEIYNYLELRDELAANGYAFRTGSDTEVLLAAWDCWGAECLPRFNGMWAFALWDPRNEVLFCARDRFGVKPFVYVDEPGGRFAFASEIKALMTLPGVAPRADAHAVFDYVERGCTDFGERTFFEGVCVLPPSHWLRVTRDGVERGRYWDLPDRPAPGPAGREAEEAFLDLLRDAVRLRLRSDVPVGSCLSGGVDSASLVAMIEELRLGNGGGSRHKTFTVDFQQKGSDEHRFVDAALERGLFESHRMEMVPDGLEEAIERSVEAQDEPFVSLSPVAYHQLMQVVNREGIRVVLNGQGADESLAGYESFVLVRGMDLVRQGCLFAASRILAGPAARNAAWWLARGTLGQNRSMVRPDLVARAKDTPWTLPRPVVGPDQLHRALYRSSFLYHLPSYLRYEDRTSMAFGLESRQPFLDYRLAEFCWALPGTEKIAPDGTTKSVLRRAMRGRVADVTLDRKDKMGFMTPDVAFFSGPMAGWFDAAVDRTAKRRDWFDTIAIRDGARRFKANPTWGNLQPVWRAVSVSLWLDHWKL